MTICHLSPQWFCFSRSEGKIFQKLVWCRSALVSGSCQAYYNCGKKDSAHTAREHVASNQFDHLKGTSVMTKVSVLFSKQGTRLRDSHQYISVASMCLKRAAYPTKRSRPRFSKLGAWSYAPKSIPRQQNKKPDFQNNWAALGSLDICGSSWVLNTSENQRTNLAAWIWIQESNLSHPIVKISV